MKEINKLTADTRGDGSVKVFMYGN